MNYVFIILGVIVVLVIIFLVWNKLGIKKYNREYDEVCLAHEKIGYPRLDIQVQFRILETGDLSPIAELVPHLKNKGTPIKLLEHYITVTKDDFKKHLQSTNYVSRNKLSNADNPKQDGIWLTTIDGNLTIINQERDIIHEKWVVENENAAIDFYTDLLWQKV